ncbi:MAG TPA: ATP-binding protein [Oculatellaceae cyanobacterium]
MHTTNLRLIITGASGVGKTTLAEKLAPKLKLAIIPELGRAICEEMGYKYIGEIPDQEGFKQRVLDAQVQAETSLHSQGFIADRSTIDCWVLWQRWNICEAMSYTTEAYYQKSAAQTKVYSKIIYVPPKFDPPEDGFRWTDKDYQKQIDRLIRMTLYEWNLLDKTLFLQSVDLDERVDEAMNWLKAENL